MQRGVVRKDVPECMQLCNPKRNPAANFLQLALALFRHMFEIEQGETSY